MIDPLPLSAMALEFARSSVLGRSKGHTAVKAAAYRAGERFFDARVGLTVDYSHRAHEVGHSEVLLPEGAPRALAERLALWEAVEVREDRHNRRASAQLAIDHIIALPRELSRAEHVALARAFARETFVSRDLAVDLNVHYHSDGNPHAHLMTTTRVVGPTGLAEKRLGTDLTFANGALVPASEQLRHAWTAFQNRWFRAHEIDARAHANDGEYPAERHLGPAHSMHGRGLETARKDDQRLAISAREAALVEDPSIVIRRVAERKSLFTHHDLYRELGTLVDNAGVFARVKAALDTHGDLIRLEADGGTWLTTESVLENEQWVRVLGERLARPDARFAVDRAALEAVLARRGTNEEQRVAAHHLGGPERLAIVVGLAGAGKSTMLGALGEAYRARGQRVTGLALAGKAAESLTRSAAIPARTIASWHLACRTGRERLARGDVVVLDEAGMVDNRTMLEVLERVRHAGAKLVLVGDAEQLQPIRAGCPFRDLAMQSGYAEIATVRRQRARWQRIATRALACGRGAEALALYRAKGHVHDFPTGVEASARLVEDYLALAPGVSRIVLAHANRDVRALNGAIRERLLESGAIGPSVAFRASAGEREDDFTAPLDLGPGDRVRVSAEGVEAGAPGVYLGEKGGRHRVRLDADAREIVVDEDSGGRIRHHHREGGTTTLLIGKGERVLFTRNDTRLGVRNGTLGTVTRVEAGRLEVVSDEGRLVDVSFAEYPHLAHGYASTVHKAQGLTVDRAFVLGSASMDRHLGYVALSRHREGLDVYLGADILRGEDFGELIARTRRQQTALDFAERHDLALEVREDVAWRFVERAAARGARDREAVPEVAVPSVDERVLLVARDLLERETERRLREGAEALERTLAGCAGEADAARAQYEAHLAVRPREGFFASRRRQALWEGERRALEQTLLRREGEARDARAALERTGAQRRYAAARAAAKAHPQAARIVREHESATRARELVDRWRELEGKIAELEREGSRYPAMLPSLQDSLRVLLERLEGSTTLRARLREDVRAELSRALRHNRAAIEHRRGHERGLER